MNEWPCIAIAGPTATGKTALAAGLAHRLGSEIFSTDSRQVYRGLDLGTGKDLAEYGRFEPAVRHHLIDIVDPAEMYGLYRFQADCYAALEDFRNRRGTGVPPVLAGGTGLYLEAMLRRYDIPHTPEDPGLRAELMLRSSEDLQNQLRGLSPEIFGRTDLSSKKRVVRSLEVALRSSPGENPLSRHPPWSLRPLVFVTCWERAALRERIAERLRQRLAAGLVEEVRNVRERGLSWERLDLLGMEYRQVAAHLRGEKDAAAMEADLLHEIHLLAKRQETYFRGLARRGVPTVPIGPEITAGQLAGRFEEWKRNGYVAA